MRAKDFMSEGIWGGLKNAALAVGLGTPNQQALYRIGKQDSAAVAKFSSDFFNQLASRLQTSTPAPLSTAPSPAAPSPAAPSPAAPSPAAPSPAAPSPAAPSPAAPSPAAPSPAAPAASTPSPAVNPSLNPRAAGANSRALLQARRINRAVRENTVSSHIFDVIMSFMKDKLYNYTNGFESRKHDLENAARQLEKEYISNKNKLNPKGQAAQLLFDIYLNIIQTTPSSRQNYGNYFVGNTSGQSSSYPTKDIPPFPVGNNNRKYGFDAVKKAWYYLDTSSNNPVYLDPTDAQDLVNINALNQLVNNVR